MNGVFDLGGTDGIGTVDVPVDEPVFRDEWEKRVMPMFALCFRAGFFGIDQFRHGIELIDPAVYLKSPYYEHWVHSIEHHGHRTGNLDLAELDRRTQHYLDHPDEPLPAVESNPELVDFINAVVPAGAPANRPTDKVARFSVGDVVRVRRDSPLGHTRRARYVRGCTGTITGAHGGTIYPDSAGNGNGENPEHLYTVKFTSTELWGDDVADPNASNYIDLWDPYLELATTEGAAS